MNKNTIILKKYLDIHEEYTATAVAIATGSLLELDSDGLVQAHSTAGGAAERLFATEDALQGKEIGDAYAAGAKIQVWVAVPGEIVNAKIAAAAEVAVGDKLASNGDGTLKVAGETDVVVGVALRAIDMTDTDEAAYGFTAVRLV